MKLVFNKKTINISVYQLLFLIYFSTPKHSEHLLEFFHKKRLLPYCTYLIFQETNNIPILFCDMHNFHGGNN